MMESQAFMDDLAYILEVDTSELSEDLELNEDNWDSMSIVGAIAIIDEHFNVTVDALILGDCTSVADVVKLINEKVGN